MADQIQQRGTVKAVSKTNKGFMLAEEEGTWYSVYSPSDCPKPGDTVEFAYTLKGEWKNVYGKARITGSGPVPAPAGGGGFAASPAPRGNVSDDKRQRSIIRQNSLAHATNLYVAGANLDPATVDLSDAADAIVELARTFEAYSSGEADTASFDAAVADTFGSDLVDTRVQ